MSAVNRSRAWVDGLLRTTAATVDDVADEAGEADEADEKPHRGAANRGAVMPPRVPDERPAARTRSGCRRNDAVSRRARRWCAANIAARAMSGVECRLHRAAVQGV